MAPRFWRAHHGIGTALLRSILFLGLLHHLNCLAFIVASAPVLLLTAFLLGVVLMHSYMPPLEDADRHLYKKIRRHNDIIVSSSDESSSSDQEEEEEDMTDLVVAEPKEYEEEAVVAWTADDERSIRSIGSLELERDARLEKLMSRRSSSLHFQRRNLIDLDVHIPARNLDIKAGDPGSAPSSLMMLRQHNNPFFHDDDDDDAQSAKEEQQLLTRHESFTAAHPMSNHRLSRFRPYFVASDVLIAGEIIDNSNSKKSSSSSSSSSISISAARDHQKQQQYLQAKVEEAPRYNNWDGIGNQIGMAVDVELISDSSDDDMSLPGAFSVTREHSSDDDEKNSFEVPSITQQVAAVGTLLAPPPLPPKESQHRQQHEEAQPEPHMVSGPAGHQPQHEQEDSGGACVALMEERQETREHPVPVVVDPSSSSPDAGATGAGARPGAKIRAVPESSSGAKSSTKFKAPSKKAVFGFFRK